MRRSANAAVHNFSSLGGFYKLEAWRPSTPPRDVHPAAGLGSCGMGRNRPEMAAYALRPPVGYGGAPGPNHVREPTTSSAYAHDVRTTNPRGRKNPQGYPRIKRAVPEPGTAPLTNPSAAHLPPTRDVAPNGTSHRTGALVSPLPFIFFFF